MFFVCFRFFFHFSILFFIFSLPGAPPGLSWAPSPRKHRFSFYKIHFKARFWVRKKTRRKKKEERKKERKKNAPTETGPPSTIAHTRTFCYSRAWERLTPTQEQGKLGCRHLDQEINTKPVKHMV